MSPHPRPTFLLLPPDPEGHTRPETLLSLDVIEQVRWIPGGTGDGTALLQIDVSPAAGSRSRGVALKGTEAEALWAKLVMLHEAEWRAVQLTAQAPGVGAAVGQALATLHGAKMEVATESDQRLAQLERAEQQRQRAEAARDFLRHGIAALLPTAPADGFSDDEALIGALRAILTRTAPGEGGAGGQP